MNGYKYVRSEDIKQYQDFCRHHIQAFAGPLPTELWHYTDANGLMGILKDGKIWTTQVSCLNDTLEQRYFGDLVHEAIKDRRKKNTDAVLEPLFRVADEFLVNRDFTAAGQFVACFSETEDDLGQWRGYGGGECGYAIGFRPNELHEAVKRRPNTWLLPMRYADGIHNSIVADVVRCAEIFFKNGLGPGRPSPELWAPEFVAAFGYELSYIAAMVKHPKFNHEAEHRMAALLAPGEHDELIFRQKRTLLARHFPLDLTRETEGERRLPITRIYVGPGPAQKVTKIGVGDLLLQCGYQNIPVELSSVPYRLT